MNNITTAKHYKMTPELLDSIGKEFDALRESVVNDLGEKDAQYIKRIVRMHRAFEVAGRGLIHFSFTPIPFVLGAASLGVAKIIENMEIGHNVMHGQYDWMNDESLNSKTYEWDTACDAASWKRTHNYEHHTWTNIIGKDRDYGYDMLRLSDDIPWSTRWRFQLINFFSLSAFFQWGVALHELEIDAISDGSVKLSEKKSFIKSFLNKGSKQIFKDYILFPALAGPFFLKVIAGNAIANLIRNIWASSVIFCGHFTEGAHTFTEEECENESKGHWYFRQLLGSSNFTGGNWLHVMTGHLSFQIEHHLFPDIPARRYRELSPKVEAICEKYGLPYNTNSFAKQYLTVIKRVVKYSKKPKSTGLPVGAI